jgi:hypothetical protein
VGPYTSVGGYGTTTFRIMTLSITTFSVTAFSIMTPYIKGLFLTLSKNHTQHNDTQHKYTLSLC